MVSMEATESQTLQLEDKFKLRGELEIWDRKKGEKDFVMVMKKKNLIVTAGKNLARDRLFTNSSDYIQYGAAGSGTTTPDVSDTDLESILGARQTFDVTDVAASGEATVEWSYSFSEANGDHTEAGLFTAVSGGTMLCRATFASRTKDETIERVYRWKITFTGV